MNVFSKSIFPAYLKYTHLFHLGVLFCSTLLVYYKVYGFSFLIGWDDQWFITNHYTEDGLSWSNFQVILTDFYRGQYAPVNQFYYTLMYSLFDYSPICFHIGSVMIHIVNIFLVYSLIKKISKELIDISIHEDAQIAFITAMLFAISPINSEPVIWVSASKVTIYAMLYLITLHAYIKYITEKKTDYFYLTILLLVLSFGAKEQAVTLPLCMILIDYVYKRNFKDPIVWYEKLPIVVLTLLFGLATIQSQGLSNLDKNAFYPVHQRILLSFYTMTEYFTKTLLPINISYLYPFPFQIGQSAPLWLWIYPVIIPLILYCLFRLVVKKWVLFGLLFFTLHILLVINIFSIARNSIIADRYVYLSSIGLYFILACIFVKSLGKKKARNRTLLTGFVYVALMMVYTNIHSQVWENAITLKQKIRTVIEVRNDYKLWKEKHQ